MFYTNAAEIDGGEKRGGFMPFDINQQLLGETPDAIIVKSSECHALFLSRDEVLGCVAHELLRESFIQSMEEIRAKLPAGNNWEGELHNVRRDVGKTVDSEK
jgi:hypothetical protein